MFFNILGVWAMQKGMKNELSLCCKVVGFLQNCILVLLPPWASCCKIPLLSKSFISLSAVSKEHFAIFAHFEDFSFPSKPSNSLFSISLCRLLSGVSLCMSQKFALNNTECVVFSVSSKAFFKHFKDHKSHRVISLLPC